MSSTILTSVSAAFATISVPSHLRVESEANGLCAFSADSTSNLIIEYEPSESAWEGRKRLVSEPLGVNPMLDSRIVRQGRIREPYSGYERIVEHKVNATSNVNFGWCILLDHEKIRVFIQIGDAGPFAEKESLWTMVVQSLRINDLS